MDNYKQMWDFPVVDNINFPNVNRIHPLMQRNVAKLYNELKSDENIERVILYGSALDFRCNSNSDIDLYIEKYNTDLKVKSLPDLECEIDIFDVELDVDAIMLCSDGLTNMLTVEQIEKVLTEEEISVEDKLIKLIKKCNVRGGTDNISIAYLVKEGEGSI